MGTDQQFLEGARAPTALMGRMLPNESIRLKNVTSDPDYVKIQQLVIVELTVFCGMWNYSNRLCEALQIDLERPDKRIEFQPK